MIDSNKALYQKARNFITIWDILQKTGVYFIVYYSANINIDNSSSYKEEFLKTTHKEIETLCSKNDPLSHVEAARLPTREFCSDDECVKNPECLHGRPHSLLKTKKIKGGLPPPKTIKKVDSNHKDSKNHKK